MLERLGDQGRRALVDTYAIYQQGLIDLDTFTDVASQLLAHIADVGANYGRLSYGEVMALLTDELPELSAQLGTSSAVDQGKIAQSLQTILEGDPEQVLTRLQRLGYVLPIEETQRGYGDELAQDPKVEGWLRGMNDDACQLCVWWWREGRIWPKRHPLQTHKGCKCQQVPKVAHVGSTQYTRGLERREKAIQNRDRRSVYVRSEKELQERLQNIDG